MNERLKDILTNRLTEIDQETLLLYLQGKLSADQQHKVEKELLENEFAAEALEGLQGITDKQKIAMLVDQLNRDLKERTRKKYRRKPVRTLGVDPILLLTLLIIILLIVVSYIIIHLYKHP